MVKTVTARVMEGSVLHATQTAVLGKPMAVQ
jgi:hypothetical protein